MPITDFTTYAEVRSAVGLSVDELPDSILATEMYLNSLELALDSVTLPAETPGPGPLITAFATIKALQTRTAKQQKLYNLTRLFATYAVALEVATSLSMRAPKMIGDSKASLTRFSSEATFRDVAALLKAKVVDLRDQIEKINDTVISLNPYLTVVSRAIDPVTGV